MIVLKTPGWLGRLMTTRKRCRRFDLPGHAHALTFSCYRRQPFLSKDRSRQWLIDSIDRAREKLGFHIWAYVVMPEHVHLLVWPTGEDTTISGILASIKRSVVTKAVAHIKVHSPDFLPRMRDVQPNGQHCYRFWQRGGGHDRNIYQPRVAFHFINYIYANPVRRELCDSPVDWKWSSAADYANVREGPLRLDRQSLPAFYFDGDAVNMAMQS